MEDKLIGQIKGLLWLTFISLLVVVGILLWDVVFVNHAPDYLVRPAASSDVEVRLQNVESSLEALQRELVSQLNQKLMYFGGAALVIAAVASFFGMKTFRDLDGLIKEKIRATLENELYQLDPANLTVRLPRGHPDTPLIRKRLELSGLHNLTEYLELNKQCLRGLTIVPVNNLEEEDRFRGFLAREKPDPEFAAFVLYTTKQGFYVSVPDTLNKYERVATSNMPATVITAVLAISRGLHREK